MLYRHTSEEDLACLRVTKKNVEMLAQFMIGFLLSWSNVNDVECGVSLNESFKKGSKLFGRTDSLRSD
jgi:hypothetical protein